MFDVMILLSGLITAAVIFERLGIGSIVGYIVIGTIIGPAGAGLIENFQEVHHVAELGVVFLLFHLGLELKLERLRLFGARIYALAITQIVFTTLAIMSVGLYMGLSSSASLVLGGALALSSTAVVVQVLSSLGRTLAQLGRIAIAVVLVQDVAVGFFLLLVKSISGPSVETAELLLSVGKAFVVLVLLAIGSRYFVRPLFQIVASSKVSEGFTGVTLLVVLSVALGAEAVGLSMTLGAFVGGIMIADTEFRHQVAAEINPFRRLFLSLFFMTVGMSIDPILAWSQLEIIGAISLGLLLLKGLIIFGLALAVGMPARLGGELAFLLSQGSEFAFVVLGVAAVSGIIEGPLVQAVIVSVALTMLITPLGANLGRRYLDHLEGPASSSLRDLSKEANVSPPSVIIVGFGQVGMALARHLIGLGVSVLALDIDSQKVSRCRALGLPVFFGNATREEVIRALHIDRTQIVVVAVPDLEIGLRITEVVGRASDYTKIVARVPSLNNVDTIQAAGATAAVPESLTTALDLAERVLLLYEPVKPETIETATS
ncbi:MAG: cation:proton antiporter [Magnetovibrio sp.]|nr:cation:proton antiporter [Magnetovibrio sp.]